MLATGSSSAACAAAASARGDGLLLAPSPIAAAKSAERRGRLASDAAALGLTQRAATHLAAMDGGSGGAAGREGDAQPHSELGKGGGLDSGLG